MHHAYRTLQQTKLASEPCRDAPVNQATAIPAISASPLLHLDQCAVAYREEYGGYEYGGLPVADVICCRAVSSNYNTCLSQRIWIIHDIGEVVQANGGSEMIRSVSGFGDR
jgi:hypothetical protein